MTLGQFYNMNSMHNFNVDDVLSHTSDMKGTAGIQALYPFI